MASFDLAAVLAAADPVMGRPKPQNEWRCAVYLSAFDWMTGWRRDADLAWQSRVAKDWLANHGEFRKAMTIRNRNAVRNVHIAFNELMAAVENRKVNAVVVPDVGVLGTCGSEARFYVEDVLVPMGVRFVDCSRGFDSFEGDARGFFKGVQTQMGLERALKCEVERLQTGGLIKRNVPYGYIYDEGCEGHVRIDQEVAGFVPRIFELASQERYWRMLLEKQVNELGCPGSRQRRVQLYGFRQKHIDGWDMPTIRAMVRNPFYMGVYDPSHLASARMQASGFDLDGFPVIQGHHPALVSPELFHVANEGLRRNYRACPTEAEGRRPCRG